MTNPDFPSGHSLRNGTRAEPNGVDEAGRIQVDHQQMAASGQLEQALPQLSTEAMSMLPATVTTG